MNPGRFKHQLELDTIEPNPKLNVDRALTEQSKLRMAGSSRSHLAQITPAPAPSIFVLAAPKEGPRLTKAGSLGTLARHVQSAVQGTLPHTGESLLSGIWRGFV
jgi:hypothetical protein